MEKKQTELVSCGTVESYRRAGYKLVPTGDVKYQRGYVSRVKPVDIIYKAGGSRSGELFVLLPNDRSTRYCFRAYMRAEYVGGDNGQNRTV